MKQKWSEQAWLAIEPIYKKIISMPFLIELMNGTLDKNKFVFYIQQDDIYLADYSKILSAIASKLNNQKHIEAFVKFASECIMIENEMHKLFSDNKFALDWSDKPTASPSCYLYTSFFMRQIVIAPVEVMAASVLPCFWVYKKVGEYILANQNKDLNNPYQSWIDTYGGTEYDESVNLVIEICDELASHLTHEQQQSMTEAFIFGTKMEWLFWDSAYRLEKWTI